MQALLFSPGLIFGALIQCLVSVIQMMERKTVTEEYSQIQISRVWSWSINEPAGTLRGGS